MKDYMLKFCYNIKNQSIYTENERKMLEVLEKKQGG